MRSQSDAGKAMFRRCPPYWCIRLISAKLPVVSKSNMRCISPNRIATQLNERNPDEGGCGRCRDDDSNSITFTVAFQPIVDVRDNSVFAYEALVRRNDTDDQAAPVLAQVTESNRYRFDQACRVKAIELAARLDIPCFLSINFLPKAVFEPSACIRQTLDAARRLGFPTDRIIFEFTENQEITDRQHLTNIVAEYRRLGFKTAIDDFGDGYAGLNLLTEFRPDFIKISNTFVHDIDIDPTRASIVKGVLAICSDLNIRVIAENVESVEQLTRLKELGIVLFQGFLFARSGFEFLPEVRWP